MVVENEGLVYRVELSVIFDGIHQNFCAIGSDWIEDEDIDLYLCFFLLIYEVDILKIDGKILSVILEIVRNKFDNDMEKYESVKTNRVYTMYNNIQNIQGVILVLTFSMWKELLYISS